MGNRQQRRTGCANELITVFVGHGHSAGGYRLLDMLTTIVAQAGNGQKQTARLYLAAVCGQAADFQRFALPLGKELLQLHYPRPSWLSRLGSSTCCSSLRLSGVMFSRRRALDIRPLNTGAATRPP